MRKEWNGAQGRLDGTVPREAPGYGSRGASSSHPRPHTTVQGAPPPPTTKASTWRRGTRPHRTRWVAVPRSARQGQLLSAHRDEEPYEG